MADDIDDLLDEVESKFLVKKGSFPSPEISAHERSPRASYTCSSSNSVLPHEPVPSSTDLTDAIDDICSISESAGKSTNRRSSTFKGESEKNSTAPQRCFKTYLGGSKLFADFSSSSVPRPCSNLRCTTCDFKVVMFNNYVWDKHTDHFFLRNNMPDFDRLRARLLNIQGWRAYSCQCHCTSMSALVEVRKHEILKWVCGGHITQKGTNYD